MFFSPWQITSRQMRSWRTASGHPDQLYRWIMFPWLHKVCLEMWVKAAMPQRFFFFFSFISFFPAHSKWKMSLKGTLKLKVSSLKLAGCCCCKVKYLDWTEDQKLPETLHRFCCLPVEMSRFISFSVPLKTRINKTTTVKPSCTNAPTLDVSRSLLFYHKLCFSCCKSWCHVSLLQLLQLLQLL